MKRTIAITLGLLATLSGTGWAEEIDWRPAKPRGEAPAPGQTEWSSPTVRGQSESIERPPHLFILAEEEPETLPAPKPLPAEPSKPATAALPHSLPEHHPIQPAGYPPMSVLPPDRPFFSPNMSITNESLIGAEPFHPVPATRSYVRAEYLLWWVSRDVIPPLITTSSPGSMGILGNPDTRILIGDESAEGGENRDGLRVRAGTWLEGHDCGIDAGFFFLSPFSRRDVIPEGRFPVLSRPIFAPNFGAEFVELIAFPGLSTGGAEVFSDSNIYGADVNFRKCLCTKCDLKAECFAGFRYLGLDEELRVTEFITAQDRAPMPPGTRIVVQDRFETNNNFYGGQIGTHIERWYGRFILDLRTSIAMGVTQQNLDISGFQVIRTPGQPVQRFVGGLLTTPTTNVGRFRRDEFSVVPEITLNFGYQLTNNFRIYAGYNFLYWSNVIRPGTEVDRVVDVALVPNPPVMVAPTGLNRPAVQFTQRDLWVQGAQFGAELRW